MLGGIKNFNANNLLPFADVQDNIIAHPPVLHLLPREKSDQSSHTICMPGSDRCHLDGLYERALGRKLNQVLQLRNQARYKYQAAIGREHAEAAIQLAKALIELAEKDLS
ncbi:hypothetical protein MYX75_00575 [Acidobacteria bacterium AH-259-A15]|nr:hypothetical protein [Acidobacteria bacterium AH-259-A15]